MEAAVKQSVIEISGLLNEEASLDAIKQVIIKTSSDLAGHPVRLDLSGVKRANSVGILNWFKLLETLTMSITYIKAPLWLVEQFNFSSQLKPSMTIESVNAPFYCPETEDRAVFTLVIGKDIPIQSDYDDFVLSRTGADGRHFEPDFEPSEYFQFIASNIARFKESA